MLKQYSIAKARDHFTSLVRTVERESAVELTRRGKPVAVILSIREYERLSAQLESAQSRGRNLSVWLFWLGMAGCGAGIALNVVHRIFPQKNA